MSGKDGNMCSCCCCANFSISDMNAGLHKKWQLKTKTETNGKLKVLQICASIILS
jgi:hypothetical protein